MTMTKQMILRIKNSTAISVALLIAIYIFRDCISHVKNLIHSKTFNLQLSLIFFLICLKIAKNLLFLKVNKYIGQTWSLTRAGPNIV